MHKDRNTVLVTGATGNQGGAVIRELLANGYRVKAMTRNPAGEAAKVLAAQGAEIIQADMDDPGSLEGALAGTWGVFAVQNTWEAGVEREEQQGKRLAEIARRQDVQHYVYSSVGSAHRSTGIPHFDNKWRVEETVRSLGFPSYVILRPVFFMENWLSPWFKPGIDQGRLMVGLQPETVLQMIAVQDIGRYGRLAFEQHQELNGRAIDIAGDQLTMPQTASILSEVMGRPITFEPVPLEEVRKFSDDFALMLEWFDRVGYDVDIPALEAQYGARSTRFQQWAEQHAMNRVTDREVSRT
jgi:uncharacterized protein YbjT (DUF2867 family)